MAKQKTDLSTFELPSLPKKRGRPASGKALSNSERQAKYKALRDLEKIDFLQYVQVNCSEMDFQLLLSALLVSAENSVELYHQRACWHEIAFRKGFSV